MMNLTWYDTLTKPFLTPPSFIFTPVWIVLYLTILASLVIYITTPCRNSKLLGYIYFITQILLNILWTPAFFIVKNITIALIILILLDIFTILTINQFRKVSKLSGNILIPYLIWLLFATYLNTGILILN